MMTSNKLTSLRDSWLNPSSRTSIYILLELTNTVLLNAAISSNKFIKLGTYKAKRKPQMPPEIKKAQVILKECLKKKKDVKAF